MADELRNAVGQWSLNQTITVVDTSKNYSVAGSDASRWMIAFSTVGNFPSSVYVSPTPITLNMGVSDRGFSISQTPTVFTYRDWGAFVGGQWYAMASSGSVSLQVFTASINPNL